MAPWPSTRGRNRPQAPANDTAANDLVTRIHHVALETPTTLPTLPRNPDVVHAAADESSSSDSETQMPRITRARSDRVQHSRSMSHPFTSMFGGKRSGQVPEASQPLDRRGIEDVSKTSRTGANHRRGGAGPSGSKDFATGNCMTCASMMRWPKDLMVFKCGICATINDLETNGGEKSSPRKNTSTQSSSSLKLAPHRVPAPPSISLEHSRHLVRQCLLSYMRKILGSNSNFDTEQLQKQPEMEQAYGREPANSDAMAPKLPHGHDFSRALTNNGLTPTYTSQYEFDDEPTLNYNSLQPKPSITRSYSSSYPENSHTQGLRLGGSSTGLRRKPSSSVDTEPKKIFKPLEDYIINCFGSFDCVNSSFTSHSARNAKYAAPSGLQPIRRKPVPRRQLEKSQNLPEVSIESSQEPGLFEVDPKFLLIGDIAENGTWWTGGQAEVVPATSASNEREGHKGSLVTSRSPQINWSELTSWYLTISNAADSWFKLYEELSREPNIRAPTEDTLKALERDLLQAQEHLQRVLFKAFDMLLKRPGRPVAEPSRLRFLLIMLANPLFNADHKPFGGLIQPIDSSIAESQNRGNRHASHGSGLISGRHSGIIKRIIGLLSNSSTQCHYQIIAWLARYPRTIFVQIKELLSGFLAYRLLRQSDNEHADEVDVTAGLIPQIQVGRSSAYLHDEIGSSSATRSKQTGKKNAYADDWQTRAAARVFSLVFAANNLAGARRHEDSMPSGEMNISAPREGVHANGQILPTSDFYSSLVDYMDLVGDFEAWESNRGKFSFCQYPFLLSIWAKKQILEYDAHRQMQTKARDAFFDSIMTRKNVNQFLVLDIRRDCLVDDSLQAVSEVMGSGGDDIKKRLRVQFRGEEGIDGGGLRKEWFLLLVREVFNPGHGLFTYDEDSRYCYFNPNSFETSDQFFLVGIVMGLAIYNSTILDVALPPFAFRKLLAAAPSHMLGPSSHQQPSMRYTLNDLAEYRPRLARGLRQLLDFDGDVEEAFCLDFVIEIEKYGTTVTVPLCPGGEHRPVTNSNMKEYVNLYIKYLLDTSVSRQFEPFKRGFYAVCGGNAFSLFRPEEVELLVRGSDEALDIESLRAVAEYDNWGTNQPDGSEPLISWFWESFQQASSSDQRRLLLFVTGSDRIPAMGAPALPIKISCLGEDCNRLPIARTCFNLLSLWRYETKEKLETKLWMAVRESEGFGFK